MEDMSNGLGKMTNIRVYNVGTYLHLHENLVLIVAPHIK